MAGFHSKMAMLPLVGRAAGWQAMKIMSKRNTPLAHAPEGQCWPGGTTPPDPPARAWPGGTTPPDPPVREEGGEPIPPEARRIVRDEEKIGGAGPEGRVSVAAWVSLLIVWVVWGSTYLAIRVGVETMPPLLMAAARNLVAGLIMFPLAIRSRRAPSPARLRGALRRRLPSSLVPRSSVQAAPRPSGSLQRAATPRWPTRAEWVGCAIVGILLLIATVPLWLLGIDAGLNHARLGLAPMAGLALGLAGVAMLSGLGGSSRGVSVVGVITILGAAAAWALGTIMARRVTIPRSPALASGMQLLCGGVVLLVLAAAAGEFGSLRLAEVSARSWLALGYLIVVGSIVAFSAYGIAVRALPTATVEAYAYVNPVIAVLLGTLILNERLTPAMIGGGVLLVGAVVLVVRRSPPAH